MGWHYKGEEIDSIDKVPGGAIGFVYKICDEKGKCYIGKKNFFSERKVEVSENVYNKLKASGEEVTRTKNKTLTKSGKGGTVWRYKKVVSGESDWLTYNSSNSELKKLAKKEALDKEILQFCYTKQELTYYETKFQMEFGVIETDNWYNENVLGKFYKGVISKTNK